MFLTNNLNDKADACLMMKIKDALKAFNDFKNKQRKYIK